MGVSHLLRLWQGCEIKDDAGIELARERGTGMTDWRTAAARFFGFDVCLAKIVERGNQGAT